METEKSITFPPVGQRIIKSVIAVALCFCIYYIRGKRGIPFYSALAVLQCIQPYDKSMKEVAKKRTIGTFIGAFWGLVVILILKAAEGDIGKTIEESFFRYMLISVFTGVVLYSTVVWKCKNASYFSCVVFLSITVMHISDHSPFIFVLNRVMDTLIGIGIALVVNSAHFPREKKTDVLFVSGVDDTILDSRKSLTPYSKVELNRVIADGAKFTVSTIRTPASVREAMEGVQLNMPVIAMDGSVLYDMKEGEYLMKYQMSHMQAERMQNYIRQNGCRCFVNTVVENLLVIYYSELINEAENGIYASKKKSPYRNYVRHQDPVCDNVVYLFVIDEKKRIVSLYEKLRKEPWASEYRIVIADSENYPGYAHLKIYQKDATREHMLANLKALTGLDKTVTFGSIRDKYDVWIGDADRNVMVKELKRRYEPVKRWGKRWLR